MAVEYTVALSKVIEEMNLEILHTPKDPAGIAVGLSRVNRPGLPFAGFYGHYERERIQIIGKSEKLYLDQLHHFE
jgi:HPr kinase/phosphorylase